MDKPVYAFRRKGFDDFCTCSEKRFLELSRNPQLFETRVFYTEPPTAHPAAVPLIRQMLETLEMARNAIGHPDNIAALVPSITAARAWLEGNE